MFNILEERINEFMEKTKVLRFSSNLTTKIRTQH